MQTTEEWTQVLEKISQSLKKSIEKIVIPSEEEITRISFEPGNTLLPTFEKHISISQKQYEEIDHETARTAQALGDWLHELQENNERLIQALHNSFEIPRTSTPSQ